MDPGSGAFLFCSEEDSIHAQLRENNEDFTDLQLLLNVSSNLHNLTDALWHNETVEQAVLLVHESCGGGPQHEVLLFFAVLGRLPQLTRLYFNTYRFPFVARLPVRAFTNVSRSARNLVEFRLWRTDFCTTLETQEDETNSVEETPQKELEDWAKALSSCQNLREFRMIKCRFANTGTQQSDTSAPTNHRDTATIHRTSSRRLSQQHNNDQDSIPPANCSLDPILISLSKLPRLREVEVSATQLASLGNLSPKALKEIMQAPNLQSFSLSNFDLSEEAVVVIAHSLVQPNDNHTHRATTATSNSQRTRCTVLNQQSQYAPNNNNNNSHHLHTFSHRSNIKNLRLSGVGSTASMFTKPIREAFRQVLLYNYQLERLFLFDERNLQEEIAFAMKLNRLGRKRLLWQHEQKQATRQEWVSVFIQVRDDLDCLFYFLNINPLLLQQQQHPS